MLFFSFLFVFPSFLCLVLVYSRPLPSRILIHDPILLLCVFLHLLLISLFFLSSLLCLCFFFSFVLPFVLIVCCGITDSTIQARRTPLLSPIHADTVTLWNTRRDRWTSSLLPPSPPPLVTIPLPIPFGRLLSLPDLCLYTIRYRVSFCAWENRLFEHTCLWRSIFHNRGRRSLKLMELDYMWLRPFIIFCSV